MVDFFLLFNLTFFDFDFFCVFSDFFVNQGFWPYHMKVFYNSSIL